MTTDDIRRDEQDGIIVLTFTRDAKRNAVTPHMLETIAPAGRDLGDDDAYRVLVITGEGRYFTAGLDIGSLATNVGEGTDGIVRGSNMRRQYRAQAFHDLFDEIEMVESPSSSRRTPPVSAWESSWASPATSASRPRAPRSDSPRSSASPPSPVQVASAV